MATRRFKLLLSYRGTHYHGWQQQPVLPTYKGELPPPDCGIPTIQETLASAMGHVLGHPVTVVGSSRTDAGVHAKGQVAHFDTDQSQIPLENLRRAVNHRLPQDILIREISPAADDFDAITAAKSKRYQYFVWNAPDRNPFFSDLCWHRWQAMDVAAMKIAAAHMVGEHDFTSFCRPGHHRETTVRTVYQCQVSSRGPQLVIGIEGNGFLWNMVRIMAGTLVEVGLEKYLPEDIPRMLAARDRTVGGSTAPPQGLWLQWIKM
ncbi:MAG: tRNA pseudouridine(38-40) synthase TruA [Tepidisphaeraceae bacterium]|jgi:tRNA pseudouridine38-40 synthase